MNKYKAIKINGIKYNEHRYIMEQFLGRKLHRDEVVHHKDGDKTNNSIENLILMPLSEHSREHQLGKIVSKETKQKLSEALKGHISSNRKLNEYQIEQIKELHKEGYTNRKIAKIFNISSTTVSDILNKKIYKN